MADIVTGLGINIFGTGYTGGAGQTGLIVSVNDNALKVDSSAFTQPVIGTGVAGTAATGVVTIQGIAGMTPVEITGNITAVAGGTQIVSGTVSVTGSVTAIPSGTQTIQGTITTVPSGTQTVEGTVGVSGTVTAVIDGTQSVIGTGTAGSNYTTGLITIQGSTTGVAVPVTVKDALTGIVHDYNQADVAASSSGTVVTKGISSGSFILKGVQSSSSAGPVKIVVVVTNSTTTTTLSVGFFSSASPFVFFDYPQGYVLSSGDTVSVVGTNNAILSQTIYSSINGLSI